MTTVLVVTSLNNGQKPLEMSHWLQTKCCKQESEKPDDKKNLQSMSIN